MAQSKSVYDIPFNRPSLVGEESALVAQSFASGHLSGDGAFTKRCHSLLEQLVGSAKALLTTSCTHALEMSAILLNIREGDEVIIPSFTFVSTVNAFVLRGAKPVFADVRTDTLNIDETKIEALVTEKTKAIVPVHYAGVGCEMDEITRVAKNYGLAIVEDNAHGFLGTYKQKNLGTFGALATLSFHETKNFQCGEGGALLINDPTLIERAEIIREKGTNRSRFFRGQVDKYTWVDLGSSYLPSDMLAAFLCAQLEQSELVTQKRKSLWDSYYEVLSDWSKTHGIVLPAVPTHCDQPYHMFYLMMPSLEMRQAFIEHLKKCRVQAVYHYLPLHLSDMGQKLGGRVGDCPVTESISDRLVRLPFFHSMTQMEQDQVIRAVLSF